MACLKLKYHQSTELRIVYSKKRLTLKESDLNGRRYYRYKYNGKELQDELGLNVYDYGARIYDPAVSRFWQIDPLADERTWVSPYNYVQNNPLNRIDPDGKLDWEPVKGQPGKWKAQPGDSAWSLSKDANISPEKANQIVESQLGPNYVKDGKVYSNVEVGDVVAVPSKAVEKINDKEIKGDLSIAIDNVKNKVNEIKGKAIEITKAILTKQLNEYADNIDRYDSIIEARTNPAQVLGVGGTKRYVKSAESMNIHIYQKKYEETKRDSTILSNLIKEYFK